jgi:hypothetical protein
MAEQVAPDTSWPNTTGPGKSAVNQPNLMTLVHPAVAEPDA